MEAAVEQPPTSPGTTDARAALEPRTAGDFESDEELAELALREFPFYFAATATTSARTSTTLRSERPNADALQLLQRGDRAMFDLRPELARIDGADARDHRRGRLHHRPASCAEHRRRHRERERSCSPATGHFVVRRGTASLPRGGARLPRRGARA